MSEERYRLLEERLRAAERRAERAERQVTLLARAGAGFLVLGVCLFIARPALTQAKKVAPTRVTKSTIPVQIVDGDGRLILTVDNGRPGPQLQLFGSTGKAVAVLGSDAKGGGRLTLFDRTGKVAFTKP